MKVLPLLTYEIYAGKSLWSSLITTK